MWQKTKNVYHLFVALLANARFGFPGRKIEIIGVTGTDGKTTTVNLIFHILKNAGKNVAMVSTTGASIKGEEMPLKFHVTTPSSHELQSFISKARKENGKESFVVLEVSSHSIDQFRVWGIKFAVGIITNVTNEHLDYHKTYDNYLKTKAKLLKSAKVAIVNIDDESYPKLSQIIDSKKTITYGIYKEANITPAAIAYKSPLVGEFNSYNILAAIAACRSLKISNADIKRGIETFQTPKGRMNKIPNDQGKLIYVDYAHTPNGLKQVLLALNSERKKDSKLISIIGAEGFRDKGKREKLGEIAAKLSDVVVITAVDPRGLIEEINKQILIGVEKNGKKLGENIFIENDRKNAINLAVKRLSKKGDIIGIFGKGHELSMNYDGKHEIPWSDTKEVENALRKNE